MDIRTLLGQIKNHKPLVINIGFYGMGALLVAIAVCYGIFAYKISDNNKKIAALDQMLLVYASKEQKAAEKDVFDYKKKVDDFSALIGNHRMTSQLFNFIEEKTLSNVWYSNFAASGIKQEISLSGEAEDMETLSRQIRIFEANKGYIKSINVLNSQVTAEGAAKFILNISLNPDLFIDKQ